MKRFLVLGLAMMLSIAVIGKAEALPITGDITFGGTLLGTLNLGTTTVVDFNPQAALVTSVTGGSALDTTIDFGSVATFNDFQFNPFVPNNPLWTVGGFSFSLNSVTINTQNTSALVLLGAGDLSGNGFDATPYEWSFSADRTRNTVAFSATNANATSVPEPATLLLLASGLAGIGWLRRKRNN